MELVEDPKVGRKVMIVVEDDGGDNFKFYLDGDIGRIGLPQIPASLYSPAEFWGAQFFQLCNEFIQKTNDVKRIAEPKGAS